MPELSDFTQPIPQDKSLADKIVPFLAGTGNQLLFGAPQAIIENLGGREAVKKYLEENKDAYGAGEFAGTIGSSFIPGLGLAGKGLKAAGALAKGTGLAGKIGNVAAKTGQGLEKLNAVKKGVGLIGKGAAEGVLQQATRNVFQDEEKNPNPIGSLVEAGAMGGLGGGLGAAVGKLGFGAKEAADTARNAVIYSSLGSTPRMLKSYIQSMGVGGWGSKMANVEQKLDDLAQAVTGKNLAGVNLVPAAEKIDKAQIWRKAIISEMEKLDEAYKAQPLLIDQSVQSARPRIIDEVREALSADVTDPGDIISLSDKINGTIASKKSLVAKKVALNNIMNTTSNAFLKGEDLNKKAMYLIARKYKDALDDAAMEFAETTGNPRYGQAIKEYGMMEGIISPSVIKDELSSPGLTGGSSTFEKSQVFKAFQEASAGDKGALGRVVGAIPGAAAIGQLVNAATPFVVNKGVAQSYKGLSKALGNPKVQEGIKQIESLEEPLGKLLPKTSVAPEIMRQKNRQETIESPEEVAKVMKGGEAPKIEQNIETAINRAWGSMYSQYYANDPTAYDKFRQGALRALTNPADGTIDAAKAATILFPNEEDRKQYLKALEATRLVSANVEKASRVPQGWATILPDFLSGVSSEERASRGVMIDAFQKSTGIDKKEAEAIVDKILSSGGSKQQKVAKLVLALESGNPEGFKKLKALGGA